MGPRPVSDIRVSNGQTDSWADWPAGWRAQQLTYCLPEKTELVKGVEKPWLYPILHLSSDEPRPLAQEACPQAQTSLIPLSTTGLPHLALTCLQDPCIWCHKDPGSISSSSDTASHSGIQGVHILSTLQGVRKDRLQVYLFLKGKNKGGRRNWRWVMITILQKEPGEDRNLTQVADPRGMKGAIRIPVSRPVWDSAKRSQTLNQEGVNGKEGIDGGVPLDLSRGRLCGVCQFPWYKYSHYSLFQATNVTSTTSQKSWRFHNQLLHVCISQLRGVLNRVHGHVFLAQGWLGGRKRQWQQERPLIRD